MRLRVISSLTLTLALLASASMRAQSTTGRVSTTAGLHTATFATPDGTILVHVPSDAAPGDLISGLVLVEAAGATAPDRGATVRGPQNLVLDFLGQETPISNGRYQRSIPIDLRAGSVPLMLRDTGGRFAMQAFIPIDPLPAPVSPAGSAADTVEVPTEGVAGQSIVIRRRAERAVEDRVTFGGNDTPVLASSPRQVVLRVPTYALGLVAIGFTAGGPPLERMFRAYEVRVSASRTQLLRGQRADLRVTVRGLSGLTATVRLDIANQSVGAVRIDGIDRPVTITAGQVTRDGAYSISRRITGITPGPFQIAASVGQPPLSQFDVLRTTVALLADWEARTGVVIAADAKEMVQRSVVDARRTLDEFLSQQRAQHADAREVFAGLLSHYLFDLRDDGLVRRRSAAAPSGSATIRLVAFRQSPPARAGVTAGEVQRYSFSDFLSRLTSRFTARQAVGYLFVRSTPRQAEITVDGQRQGELTDRRIVAAAGSREVIVRGARICRQRVTVNAFQTEVIDCAN